MVCEYAHLFVHTLCEHFRLPEFVPDLSWKAFCAYRKLVDLTFAQNTKHIPPSFNHFLASQVSHSTFRNYASHNLKLDRDCTMWKTNNNIRFTTRVVFELRKYVKLCGQMTTQSFTSILPFLQCVINHKNLPKRKRRGGGGKSNKNKKGSGPAQYNESTFRIALNILCAHAGHPNVLAKDVVTEILLEVILHIPRLRDQAESTLHEVAKLYLPNDLSPLLRADVLFSPFPSIRMALLKTLSFYPPLNSKKNDGLFVQRKALYFPSHKNIISTLWMTRFDGDEELSKIGRKLWNSYWMKIGHDDEEEEEEGEGEDDDDDEEEKEVKEAEGPEDFLKKDAVLCEKIEDEVFRFLRSKNEFLRNIASKAIAEAVIKLSERSDLRVLSLCKRLISSFNTIGETGRFSIIKTFTHLYRFFETEDEVGVFYKDFILDVGLSTREEVVRNEVVQCALDALKVHAKEYKSLVTDIFNTFLKEKGKEEEEDVKRVKSRKGKKTKGKFSKDDYDFVVGNVSTFLGFVAQYHEDDNRILAVMDQLVETLSIPSNRVQKSCMEALSSLVNTLCTRFQDQQHQVEEVTGEEDEATTRKVGFELPPKVDGLMKKLLEELNDRKANYGVRRGRAYGITAIIKGGGITTLKKYEVMKKLHVLAYSHTESDRETALISYELFSSHLVPYFEAYLSQVVPPILFGMDKAQPPHVLSQAERALEEVMKRGMSEFSARLITPKVLHRLSNEATFWRVKVGCAKLIGYMASVSPRQLDVTLPIIVNALMGCLSDVNPEVSKSAFHALKRLGSVVKNRNVLSILPDLLEALNNPSNKTMMLALRGILRTKFTYTLDAAAITLLVPVLSRGMADIDVKVNLLSAKIIGMICGYLVKNFRILVPYVPKLLEGLRKKLIGPDPEVRATAAKAIGRIAKVMFAIDAEEKELKKKLGMGGSKKKKTKKTKKKVEDDEEGEGESLISGKDLLFRDSGGEDDDEDSGEETDEDSDDEEQQISTMDEMMGETMEFINDLMEGVDVNDIEREGAAMAISEIAASQGSEYVSHQLHEHYLPKSQHEESKVREGYLKLFTYLPILMSNEYEPFLKVTLTRTLQGLSDPDDTCRETCYRGSSVMIRYFGIKFVELILPILLIGLQNEMWRTRLNCLKLLSNLLHNITIEEAIKKKEEEEREKREKEEEEEESGEDDDDDEGLLPIDEPILDLDALERVLTQEVTHEILSIIFLAQCDENLTVRSKALFLWRSAIESNSETVLSNILPSLLNIIIEHLSGESSSSDNRRRMAARACNILVEKLGGKNIVGKLVPILSQRITEENVSTRVGVCVGMSEIMKSSTTGTLRKYSKTLLRVVKVGICDAEKEVQVAASHAFNELSKVIGEKEVVKHIVRGLIYDLLSQEKEKREASGGGEQQQQQPEDQSRYNCLSGLTQLVKTNPRIVLPVLIPSLLVEDMQDIHLFALGRIAKQSGHLFVDYYEEILRNLLKNLHKRNVLDASKIFRAGSGSEGFDHDPLFFAISKFCQTSHVHKESLEVLVDYLDQSLSLSNRGRARRKKKKKMSSSISSDRSSETDEKKKQLETTLTFPVVPASVFLQVLILCLTHYDPSKSSHFFYQKGRKVGKTPVMKRDRSFKFQISRTLLGSLFQFMNSEVEEVVVSCSWTIKLLLEQLLDDEERILILPTLRDHLQKFHQILLDESTTKSEQKRKVVVVSSSPKLESSQFSTSSSDIFPIQLPKSHLSCFKVDILNKTFLSLFLGGIMSKKSEPKEAAIYCLRYLIELTPPNVLQKYVAKAAGRLVRFGGGAKIRWQIKIVILETLVTLIHLGGKKILLYTSQLQTIFVKGLQSPTQLIRDKAARALGLLVSLGKARVVKLVKELHSAIKRFKAHSLAYDLSTCSVCVGVMKGLEIVLLKQGEKVDQELLKEVISTIVHKIFEEERIGNMDILRWGSNVVGACMKLLKEENVKKPHGDEETRGEEQEEEQEGEEGGEGEGTFFQEEVMSKKTQTQVLMVRGALKHAPSKIVMEQDYILDLLIKVSEGSITDIKESIQVQAIQLFHPYILQFCMSDNIKIDEKVMKTISNTCGSRLNVVRYHGFELIRNISKKLRSRVTNDDPRLNEVLFPFVPVGLKGTKDKHTPTKLIAEQAIYHLLNLEMDKNMETFNMYIRSKVFLLQEREDQEEDGKEEKEEISESERKKVLLRLCKKIKKRTSQQQDLLREEEEEEEEY